MQIAIGTFLGQQQVATSASSITIDTRPAIAGTPEIGQTLTRTVGSYTGTGTVTVSNGRWQRNGSDIAGATGATYTLVAADDGTAIRWAEDVADDVDSITVRSDQLVATYAAPTATGSIADQDLTLGGTIQTIVADVTTLFSGDGLTYAVAGYPGAFIAADALRIDPNQAGAGVPVTLTATNSGGSASIEFATTVEALAFVTATLSGTGKIGAVHTAAAGMNRAGASFSYDHLRNGVSIGAADQATYTPVAADDGTTLSTDITATLDGVSVSQVTNTIGITYTAPAAAGGLSDVSYSTGSGDQTVDASADFTGGGLSWAVSGMGATINSAGVVTIPTTAEATGTVTVTATNSGGSAQSAFSVTISDAATTPATMAAPVISAVGYEAATVTRGTAPADGGAAITRYVMRWRDVGGTWTTVDPFGATEDLTGLTDDTGYEAQQAAVNGIGQGDWSASGTWTTSVAPGDPALTGLDATTGAPTDFEITTPVAQSVSWIVDQNATRTAAQVIAGGGQDSGTEYLPTGTHAITYAMDGAATGTYYVHAVHAAGDDSDVLSASFAFTAPAPPVWDVTGGAGTATATTVPDINDFTSIGGAGVATTTED